jgi:nicotinamide/nicotinate riboside kinase
LIFIITVVERSLDLRLILLLTVIQTTNLTGTKQAPGKRGQLKRRLSSPVEPTGYRAETNLQMSVVENLNTIIMSGPASSTGTRNEEHSSQIKAEHTIIIAITGPSSSGKTTLSKYVLSLFSSVYSSAPDALKPYLLHQDDFYIPDSQLPSVKLSSGEVVANWDCAEALDIPRLARTLKTSEETGGEPDDFESIQHLNDETLTTVEVSEDVKSKHESILRECVKSFLPNTRVLLLDGFLLLTPNILEQVKPYLFGVIMLRTTREEMILRRAKRDYATVEGATWADPKGYVEDVVWPGYVNDHAFLFEDGDVTLGKVKTIEELEPIRGLNLEIAHPGALGAGGIEGMLTWGVDMVANILGKQGISED